MAKKFSARCACGVVKFEFNTDPEFVALCHCLDCKKASGGEAAMFFGVPDDDFTLTQRQAESGALHCRIWQRPVSQLLSRVRRQSIL
jgi:hypothetical protein